MRGDVPLSLLGASSCHQEEEGADGAATRSYISDGVDASRGSATRGSRAGEVRSKATQTTATTKKNPNKTLRRVTRASSRRRWRRSLSVTPKPQEHAEHCCHRPAGVSWRAVAKQTPLPSLLNLLARFPSCLFSSVFL